MEAEAADIAKAAKAWAALMDRARDCGFSEIADGDPVVMAGTYIMAINEVMADRDRLNAELKETRNQREYYERENNKLRCENKQALDKLMERAWQRQDKPPLTLLEAATQLVEREKTNSDLVTGQAALWRKSTALDAAYWLKEQEVMELRKCKLNPIDAALLEWAREQVEAGRIDLRVDVRCAALPPVPTDAGGEEKEEEVAA